MDTHKMAQAVLTDKEFSDLLHELTGNNKEDIEKQNKKSMLFALHVYTRHEFNGKLSLTLIILDSLPEIGASFNRYDLMRAIGYKYYEDSVKGKPAGQKAFPLAIFLNSEVWIRKEMNKEEIAKYRSGEKKGIDWGTLPEDQREEAIVTAGMTMDKRTNMATMQIKRPKSGEMFLANPVFMEYDSTKKKEMQSDLLENFYAGFLTGMGKEFKN